MKKSIFLFFLLFSIGIFAQKINWKSIEQAEVIQKSTKKPLFIDIYTDWCGWCKKMDNSTFLDKKVIEKINKDYIPVKLDAEQKKDINFMGHKFNYVEAGNRGINTLAYNLLQGQMSFPSYVILTKDGKIIDILRGYFEASEFTDHL